ncbi:hypothetical protein RQP46_004897 [Phenoliferia psychrophenolica]
MSSAPATVPSAPFTKTVHSAVYDAISPASGLAGAAKAFKGCVLITGAGRGIGAAAAQTFALAGARKVVITARSAKELDEVEEKMAKAALADGRQLEVLKVVADVLNEQDVERLFKIAGDVEVLLNNAGALENITIAGQSKVDEWWSTYEVNIKGTYLPTRELLKQLEGTTRIATIINTSSVGSTFTVPGFSAYMPTKSAINRLTEFIHYEYPNNVRAFAIHPGGVMTTLSKAMPEGMHFMLSDSVDLSGAYCLWLSTQPEADFLRGRYTSCNWDVNELVARKEEIIADELLFTVVKGQEPTRM